MVSEYMMSGERRRPDDSFVNGIQPYKRGEDTHNQDKLRTEAVQHKTIEDDKYVPLYKPVNTVKNSPSYNALDRYPHDTREKPQYNHQHMASHDIKRYEEPLPRLLSCQQATKKEEDSDKKRGPVI